MPVKKLKWNGSSGRLFQTCLKVRTSKLQGRTRDSCFLETNGKFTNVKHFDSKAKVEVYAREVGLPSTFFMPAAFMSSMFGNFKKVGNLQHLAVTYV